MKKLLVVFLIIFLYTPLSYAQDYYAMIAHKSKNNNYLARIVKCPDKDTCLKVVELNSIDLNNNWRFAEAECLTGPENDQLFNSVFNRKSIPEPYIYFTDVNGFPTVLKFMDISPLLIDVMISRWEKALKQQGAKNIVIIKPNK
ncbi:MAG: hypothetical protein V1739_04275 [Candidatus Omnitrophota bacterium]